jgi:hypothetical protein
MKTHDRASDRTHCKLKCSMSVSILRRNSFIQARLNPNLTEIGKSTKKVTKQVKIKNMRKTNVLILILTLFLFKVYSG